ncbi:MAG: hypothetical protein PHU44_03165 [Syntrophales bacterium]|nr:hypothetical protein [Syntrophales bacterium]MDD5641573.1 hypothetical protein [Syntrophales bacterium]
MVDDKAFWGIIGTVLGVIIGFFCNVAHTYYLKRMRTCELKKALKDECISLKNQLPMLIDIFEQCIQKLSQGKILPGPAVHSLSTVYRSSISEIYPYLSLKERNLLHVVYERLRVGDEILENYVSILSRELQEGLINDPIQGWIIRMKDQIDSYRIVDNLLKSYINKNPIDVFNIDAKPLSD